MKFLLLSLESGEFAFCPFHPCSPFGRGNVKGDINKITNSEKLPCIWDNGATHHPTFWKTTFLQFFTLLSVNKRVVIVEHTVRYKFFHCEDVTTNDMFKGQRNRLKNKKNQSQSAACGRKGEGKEREESPWWQHTRESPLKEDGEGRDDDDDRSGLFRVVSRRLKTQPYSFEWENTFRSLPPSSPAAISDVGGRNN